MTNAPTTSRLSIGDYRSKPANIPSGERLSGLTGIRCGKSRQSMLSKLGRKTAEMAMLNSLNATSDQPTSAVG